MSGDSTPKEEGALPLTPEETLCSQCGEKISKEELQIRKLRKLFCRPCWIHYMKFRFRKRLFELGRPTKGTRGEIYRSAEPTLIVYDGSPSSVALINLIRDVIIDSQSSDKESFNPRNIPFPFRFAVLVVLESDWIIGNGMVEKQKRHLRDLYKWVKDAEAKIGNALPLIVTSLEMAVPNSITEDRSYMKCLRIGDDNWRWNKHLPLYPLPVEGEYPGPNVVGVLSRKTVDDLTVPFDTVANSLVLSVLKNLDSCKTSQKDFLAVLKSRLIIDTAQQLQVYKVILPEDQTSLGIKMFSTMSLGRGSQLADLMAFTSKCDKVILGRPLMDYSSDDLRDYLSCLHEPCTDGLFNETRPKKRKTKVDTIERQCDEFIVDLQAGYPSTVSTLTRIGEKLKPSTVTGSADSSQLDSKARCAFCRRLKEQGDWTDLCYGCSRILKDTKEPERLWNLINYRQANWVVEPSTEEQQLAGEVKMKMKQEMKNEIGTTTHYDNGEVVGVTTYRGSDIIDQWGTIPKS